MRAIVRRGVLCALICVGSPAQADPRTGDRAPVLDLQETDGSTVQLIDGQITIVDFFATWCGPCHAALDRLAGIVGTLQPGVALIIVDVEEPVEVVQRFFAKRPLPSGTRVALDLKSEASLRWGRHRFPTTFVVDAGGVIRFINRGYGPGYGARLDQRVRALLRANAAAPR